MKIQFGVMAAVLILMLVMASSATAEAHHDNFFAVDNYIEQFMQKYRIPGVALAIVKGDQVVYARGYGTADSSGRPVTAQTPFILGSTGKSLTAAAVMQLVDSGKVNLDAPIQTYLPWFTLGDGMITVRYLLNHTSGISKDLGQDALISNDSSDDALEEQARKTIGAQLAHAPGTTYEYSNINYEVAGLIVQEVVGESFESYLQQSIFTPLDMQCSYTSKVEARQNGLAEGYHYWFGLPFPAGNTPLPRQKVPSGFMAICAEDMAHTLIMHLNNGKYNGVQVVSAEGIAELHRPALNNYAMGWVQNPNGILEHGGATSDFGSGIILDPRHNLGVVILYNIGNAIGTQHIAILHWNVLNILTGSVLADPPSNQLFWLFLAGMLVFLLAAVAWTIGSRVWMSRWKKQPNQQPKGLRLILVLVVPLVIELGIPAFLYYEVTTLSYGFRNLLLHQPDITILFLVFALLVFVNSASRTIMAIRLYTQNASAQLFHQAINDQLKRE